MYHRSVMRLALVLLLSAACGRSGFENMGGDGVIVDLFELGTLDRVKRDDGLVLDGDSGQFTSRVFALPAGYAKWSELRWTPHAPYGKPLPDQQGAESGYAEGAVSMAANVVLLHLDGEGDIDAGDLLADSSGRNNAFSTGLTTHAGIPAAYVAGLVGQALDKDTSRYHYRELATDSDLQFGDSDFTWAAWARIGNCPADNGTVWGTEDSNASPHIWMGCCVASGSFGGYFRGTTGTGIGSPCGNVVVDAAWHHVAVVKTVAGGSVRYAYYRDGRFDSEASGSTDPNVTWAAGTRFGFTAFNIVAYPDSITPGQFDEAAIWRRALSEAELGAINARAMLDLSFQVHFCERADCSDQAAFFGPDGTAQTQFRDGAPTLAPPVAFALTGETSRPYMQYRATFATRRLPLVPRLDSVELHAR